MTLAVSFVGDADQKSCLAWAAERCGVTAWSNDSQAVAVVDVAEKRLAAVIVFNLFVGSQCCVHIATDGSRRWASRTVLRALFEYPFIVQDLTRLTAFVAVENTASLKLVKKLGFKHEGVQRGAGAFGGNLVMSGMLRHECKWLDKALR